MAKFVIDEGFGTQDTVEGAQWYRQEGEYFVFYSDGSSERTAVVFTIAASAVTTIKTMA